MEPLTVAAGIAALAGAGVGWSSLRHARRAGAEAVRLRQALRAERHAACHDPLTGLPNRRAFYQLGAALLAAHTGPGLVAVLLDLDDFKQVNDSLGHRAGDQVLITLARRFAYYAGGNLAARLGGDEFVGLLAASNSDDDRRYPHGRDLAGLLAAPVQVAGHTVRVTASIGLVPVHGSADLAEVLHRADIAMYRAKTIRRSKPVDRPAAHRPGQPPAGIVRAHDRPEVDHPPTEPAGVAHHARRPAHTH